MPEQVSDKPWSNFKASDYTDEQWLRACLIDRGASFGSAKMRGSLPVREPDGTLNRNACAAASAVLSSAGGTGSARGNKLLGVKPAQIKAAKSKLVSLYKKVLQKDPPPGLVGVVKHSDRLIAAALKHADTPAPASSSFDTTVTVVALPSALDPIRLVGDVDKHATLLFLGEMSTLPSDAKVTLLNTLAQVADLFDKFSEPILDVRRLGSDNPPALVAMLGNQNLSKVREALLINQKIQGYQDNATQHPDYTPHVTFSYPDYQGEAKIREIAAMLYRVRFDRLALWWGDEHTEFDLSRNDNYDSEASTENSVGMSAEVGAFLSHHGVKGMKWGVRRSSDQLSKTHGGKLVSAKDRLKALVSRKKSSEASNAKEEPKKVEEQSSDTKLSEDAEKALKASLKSPAEMSTREMQDLVNRANVTKQYNDLFNKSHKSDLQKQVEQLQLQKQLRDLQNDLNPKKTSRFGIIKTSQETADFLETAARGYTAYARLNAATGGALARQLSVPVIDPEKISSLGGGGGKKKK